MFVILYIISPRKGTVYPRQWFVHKFGRAKSIVRFLDNEWMLIELIDKENLIWFMKALADPKAHPTKIVCSCDFAESADFTYRIGGKPEHKGKSASNRIWRMIIMGLCSVFLVFMVWYILLYWTKVPQNDSQFDQDSKADSKTT